LDIAIIPITALQQGFGILLLCSGKPPDDVIPVPKPVEVHKSLEIHFVLLSTCVIWCIGCKNLHNMSKIKSERKCIVKRSGRG